MTTPISQQNMIRLREAEAELDQIHGELLQAWIEIVELADTDAQHWANRLIQAVSGARVVASMTLKFVTEADPDAQDVPNCAAALASDPARARVASSMETK